jgi:hypothetical protein
VPEHTGHGALDLGTLEALDKKLLCMTPQMLKAQSLGLRDSVRKYKWKITGAELLLQSYLSLLLLSESFCAFLCVAMDRGTLTYSLSRD